MLLGACMLLGAVGAERDGQRNCAIAMAAVGAALLILRRRCLQDEPKRGEPKQDGKPSSDAADGRRMVQPKMNGTRNIIAVSPEGGAEFWNRQGEQADDARPDDRGTQMPSDLLRSGWTRKGVAVNGHGDPVLSDDPAAIAWSLSGAVNAIFGPNSAEWRSYTGALQALVGHNIVRWSRDPDRTQDEVVAVALEAERSSDGL